MLKIKIDKIVIINNRVKYVNYYLADKLVHCVRSCLGVFCEHFGYLVVFINGRLEISFHWFRDFVCFTGVYYSRYSALLCHNMFQALSLLIKKMSNRWEPKMSKCHAGLFSCWLHAAMLSYDKCLMLILGTCFHV